MIGMSGRHLGLAINGDKDGGDKDGCDEAGSLIQKWLLQNPFACLLVLIDKLVPAR